MGQRNWDSIVGKRYNQLLNRCCCLTILQVGVTMAQTVTDPLLLESCVRDELNVTARR